MNGVVFQISETMIANMAGQWEPNQLVSAATHGSHTRNARGGLGGHVQASAPPPGFRAPVHLAVDR